MLTQTSVQHEQESDFVRTGPGTLAGRYLRRFWQPIYRASRLLPGQAVHVRIMSEDFALFRGESGKAHVVSNICPHRLTRLSSGWVEGDSIRCGYHGWRFDHSGQCVEQPAESTPFCQKIKIASYPTEERIGLIFAYFGEGEPPPLPQWLEMQGSTRDGEVSFGTSPFVYDVAIPSVEMLPCNYFQSAENIMDDVHVAFAHRHTDIHTFVRRTIPRVTAEETPFGLTQLLHHPDRVDKIDFIMPNRCYLTYPLPIPDELRDTLESNRLRLLFWYVPIDDTSHYHFRVSLATIRDKTDFIQGSSVNEEVKAFLAGHKQLRDLQDHPESIRIQDAISIVGQGAIVDRRKERLGSSDAAVIRLRKIWMRELGHLAAGRPLTPFIEPELYPAISAPRKDVNSPPES